MQFPLSLQSFCLVKGTRQKGFSLPSGLRDKSFALPQFSGFKKSVFNLDPKNFRKSIGI
jgi:hypothetical protein